MNGEPAAAQVAILTGAGKSFCAGADLAAVAEGGPRMNQLEPDGDGPMGPTRMRLSKPVIAAIRGYAVAGVGAISVPPPARQRHHGARRRPRARDLVRHARGGGRCHARRVLQVQASSCVAPRPTPTLDPRRPAVPQALRSPAHRRRQRPPAAPDRSRPRHGPNPYVAPTVHISSSRARSDTMVVVVVSAHSDWASRGRARGTDDGAGQSRGTHRAGAGRGSAVGARPCIPVRPLAA